MNIKRKNAKILLGIGILILALSNTEQISAMNQQVIAENQCSICLENITQESVIFACRHVFHRSCVNGWRDTCSRQGTFPFPGPETCPNCRQILVDVNTAIFDGNIEIAQQLLQNPSTDVNAPGRYGWTPLMSAARWWRGEILAQLLAVPSIEVNKQNDDGETALMIAAANYNVAAVRQLTHASGINVNAQDSRGQTALIKAANHFFSTTEILEQLLQTRDINISMQDHEGLTALQTAWRLAISGQQDPKAVYVLLRAKMLQGFRRLAPR